jgi:hypothetical protein
MFQLAAGNSSSWTTWGGLNGGLLSAPVLARNVDGRLEAFIQGGDNTLYHASQLAANGNSGWSSWTSLGGNLLSSPTVAMNSDGRLEVFAEFTDHTVNHIWQQVGSNVSLFGYFADAFDGVGTGDYIAAVSDHSNIAWVSGDVQQKMTEAAERGMKSILSMRWQLFDDAFNLRSDYLSSWNTQIVGPVKAAGIQNIAAFYPLDEPYWNAATAAKTGNGPTPAQMKANLETVNALIRSTFPGVPIAVIFAYPSVNAALTIPQGYDWIGVDCYGPFNSCGDDVNGRKSIPEYFQILGSKVTQGQRLLAVPSAFLDSSNTSNSAQIALGSQIDAYMEMVSNNSLFVGVMPFLWQDSGTLTGTANLPILKAKYFEIGQSITGK